MIYLCGPINNRTDAECIDWRNRAKYLLDPIPTLDPIRRDYRGREQEPGLAQLIVRDDTQDIADSKALLVMFDRASVGTSMEIRMAAHEFHIPVFVVDISNQPRSPWLTYHTARFFDTLEATCQHIKAEFA